MKIKTIEKESSSRFYVIIADRDGIKKYVSRDFPRLFQYTVKISKARRFDTIEKAHEFIDNFNSSTGKYFILNPEIKVIKRKLVLEE